MDCRYVAYSFEVGEKQGTPHVQGFIYYKSVKSLKQVKQDIPRGHLSVMKGSFRENEEYCSKQSRLIERGERPVSDKERGDGEKERWEGIWQMAKENRIDEIPAQVRFRSYRTCKEIARDHMAKKAEAEDTTGIWVYGPAGCGKTRWAYDNYPNLYIKGLNKWWDGYQDEEAVLVDDMDPDIGKCLRAMLKHWTDRYPFKAETKGGAMNIRPKTVIITSQYSIEECFMDRETVAALKRRCKIIFLGMNIVS